jgi:hypothetical protein
LEVGMGWAKVVVGDRVAFYGNALGVYRRGLPGRPLFPPLVGGVHAGFWGDRGWGAVGLAH